MPYKKISELPVQISKHLPVQAQHIFLKAFNAACDEYQKPSKRRDGSSIEQTAYKIAWNAVKTKYERGKNGFWKEKPSVSSNKLASL
jgi:cation transport regulator